MPETLRVTTTAVAVNSDGVQTDTISNILSATGDSAERATPSIPAAKAGTLSTRTDDNTGVLTLGSGHGVTDAQLIDVFWSGGSRRGMTVGTVSGTSVPIDGGSGDVLPAAGTVITAMVPVEVEFVVDGDNVVGLVVYGPRLGYVVFMDDEGTPAEIAAATFEITTAGEGVIWVSGNGATNPLAGEGTTAVKFSHADSAAAHTMKAIAIFN